MREKIDRLQYFFMIPSILFGKAIGITSGVIVRKSGSDVWITMAIGFIFGTVVALLMIYAASKFPEKTMVEFSEELFGKWISKLISIILACYFAYAYAVSANVINLHLKEYFLPETPFIVLSLIYTVVCTYGVITGAEVVIRFSFFGFFMLSAINITMILGVMPDFKILNIYPILDKGIKVNVINSIYTFVDTSMVILVLGMVYPMLNSKKRVKTITFSAMIIASISVLIWPFFEVAVLGTDVMKQFVVVCMQQVRSAQLTRYLPRYELIMVSFFVWSMYVQSVLMFWCSEYCIKYTFRLKKDRKIVYILTPILIVLTSRLGKDHQNYINFLAYPWAQISAAIGIGLPVLFITAIFIKNGVKKKRKPRKINNQQ
ncbi:spore germination protein [Clostridium swellfunianum]|uniref:GerAB/ArcD/ProY family transporter n=1 Tax=Clostridium swellfunianum TaxID=1367462 RepID=UPI00202DF031|nr:endospore germination permease [Clostridium swellfunianum]MCM0650779.1 spore germination protein [Clostridium swellfunianum]